MEFEVKDMSCGGCANSITRAVTSVDPAHHRGGFRTLPRAEPLATSRGKRLP
jgi:copper chaperone CopZ